LKSVLNFTKLSEEMCGVGMKLVLQLLSLQIPKKVFEIPVPIPFFILPGSSNPSLGNFYKLINYKPMVFVVEELEENDVSGLTGRRFKSVNSHKCG